MAMFTDVVARSQEKFPALIIKYKDESPLMQFLGKLAFFNKQFMSYTTTLGSTVYFPSRNKIRMSPVGSTIILLHELSHIFNAQKTKKLNLILYIFPQALALLGIPVFFLFGLFPALLCLLFLLPIPSYFRMEEEKQAYIISLYVIHKLNKINGYNINLTSQRDSFLEEFGSSSYYYMWPIPGLKGSFDEAIAKIEAGGQPTYDSKLYALIDNILEG